IFFAAKGVNGEDLFDTSLNKRNGIYPQYHSGDINTYHLSYFRRKHPQERAFHTCNLRKSKGFELVAMGADPIPSVVDALPPYKISLTKFRNRITFSINQLDVLSWTDDQTPLTNGKIGFRQMAPLIAEYQNLNVYALEN
ncbi:MAG: YesU family protein, partial [Balneolales bacterium]|nr:YesU family protein [Balneolales bacterium]